MGRSNGLLVFVVMALAASACGGEVAPAGAEGDGGPAAIPPSSSSSSSGSGSSSGSSSGSISGSGSGGTTTTPCAGSGSKGPAGTPVVLAHVMSPSALAVDCDNLYVAPYEIGVVTALSLADGSATVLNAVAATTVAVDATRVYSVSPGGGNEPQGLVVACPKTGCEAGYATLATGQTNVWGVATDGISVYWTNQGAPGAVMKAPVGGGPPTTLVAKGSATNIVVVGGSVFYAGFETGGSALLMRVPVAGGSPTVLFTPTQDNSIEGLTVDDTNVYFTTTDGFVGQMPLDGGPLVTIATAQGNGIMGIVTDGADVYWAAWEKSTIVRTPIGGGPVAVLATGQPSASGIAVDANNVYWTNMGDGTVMELAK